MPDELLVAWTTNLRVNQLLLGAIEPEGLACTLSKRGGRDVARQFAHMHDVRVWHLQRRARELAEGLKVFASKKSPSRTSLVRAHRASGKAVERWLADIRDGRRRGFKKGLFTTLAYLVAHESHHRGSILLTLKTCGHPVDKKTRDGIWAWDQL